MFRKRNERRRMREIAAKYPLYPFEDLADHETRQQAVEYLRTRPLDPVPGESE